MAENDLLFSITAEIGMLGLIPANFEEAYINQHVGLIRFIREVQTKYFPYILMSNFCRGQYYTTQSGMKNSFRLDNIQNIWLVHGMAGACIMRLSLVSCRRFRSVRRNSMNRLTHDELAELRSRYPSGCRVKLICMNDPYRNLEAGSMGTVTHVDDMGTIHIAWDSGSTLGVVYGVDSCMVVLSEGRKQND